MYSSFKLLLIRHVGNNQIITDDFTFCEEYKETLIWIFSNDVKTSIF